MTSLSRRALLRSTALAPVALAMGCSSLTSANLQSVITDFGTIADGVTAILPSLGAINGISSATISTVASIIAGIQKVAGSVSATLTSTTGTSLVTKLETGVSGVISALSGITLPSFVTQVLNDAETMMPVVKAAVGILVPAAGPDPMAVEAARQRLQAAAATVRS